MKKSTKEDIKVGAFTAILIIIVIGILGGIIAFFVEDKENDYNSFCEEKGWEEATDYKYSDAGRTHIECDKEQIYFDLNCTREKYCGSLGLDKWGECREERSRMRCEER